MGTIIAFPSSRHSTTLGANVTVGGWGENRGVEMEQAAREWLTGRLARGEIRRNSARVQYGRLVGLMEAHGDRPLEALDHKTILAWQASIGQYKASTRRLYLSTISSFTRWLAKEGYIATDPCLDCAKIREPRRAPRALNPREVASLLASCETTRMYAVVWLMVGCGLRCIEVSRLDLRDWDRETHAITVRGKADHERSIPVPTPVRLALEEYMRERGEGHGPLILGEGSKSPADRRISARWLSKRVARQCVTAGIHVPGDGRTAHSLRHTCASDVLEKCHDVRVVQELLGHQSLETTQIYLRRATMDRMREAMEGRDYRLSTCHAS